MEKDDNQNSTNISKFTFSQTVIDLDLFKHDSVKKLLNYINSNDIELDKIKILIKKANRELGVGNSNRRLFIRKNLICLTTK